MVSNAFLKRRDFSLDALKAVAIFMVVMIHTSAPGYVSFGDQWNAALVFDSISRISVPIFFMVTGALLLPRYQSIKMIISKIWLVLVPLVVWSVLYLLWNTYYHGQHIESWVKLIIQGPVLHMWFIYSLIGAYVFLPLTSRFFSSATRHEKIWVLAAALLGSSIIPFFKDVTGGILIGIDMTYVPIYSFYMIAGAFIYEESKREWQGRKLGFVGLFVWLSSTLIIIIGSYKVSIANGKYSVTYFNYYATPVAFAAVGCFMVFVAFIEKSHGSNLGKGLSYVGKQTLGVYMCHMIPLQLLTEYISRTGGLSPWVWYPLIVILTVLSSLMLVAVIQKVPYLRRICPA